MPLAEPTASRERALAKLLPHNGLLAALPGDVQDRLLPQLGLVDLRLGQRLPEHGGACVRVFFPVAGLVSLTQDLSDDCQAPLALIGSQGMLGLPFGTLEADRPVRVTVEWAGYGLALGRDPLLREWERDGPFRRVLFSYAQGLQAELAHLAQCRRSHATRERLGTLMLMTAERLPGQDGALSPSQAARLLGVSIEAVADALRELRDEGVLIINRAGAISVADRAGLQARSCGCHHPPTAGRRRSLDAEPVWPVPAAADQSRISASISSGLTGTPREISSQPVSVTIASSSIRMPML